MLARASVRQRLTIVAELGWACQLRLVSRWRMTRRQSYASRETAQRSTRLKRFGALSNEETPVVFVILNNAEYGILKEFVLS